MTPRLHMGAEPHGADEHRHQDAVVIERRAVDHFAHGASGKEAHRDLREFRHPPSIS